MNFASTIQITPNSSRKLLSPDQVNDVFAEPIAWLAKLAAAFNLAD